MLDSKTHEQLSKIVGSTIALQVARLEVALSLKKTKKRHLKVVNGVMGGDGLFLSETIARLSHVGVTRQTWAILDACLDFEVRDCIRGCSGNDAPPVLREFIAKITPLPDQSPSKLEIFNNLVIELGYAEEYDWRAIGREAALCNLKVAADLARCEVEPIIDRLLAGEAVVFDTATDYWIRVQPSAGETDQLGGRRLQYFDLIERNWIDARGDQISKLLNAVADQRNFTVAEVLASLHQGGAFSYADDTVAIVRFVPVD